MVENKSNVPKIHIFMGASILPPEHSGWENCDIATKQCTLDGTGFVTTKYANHLSKNVESFSRDDRERQVRSQIAFIEQDFKMFKDSYPTMSFTEVRPRIDKQTNKIVYPCKDDYLKALQEMISKSISNRYFGMYYSGMTHAYSGNWAVLPKRSHKLLLKGVGDGEDEIEQISLADVFEQTKLAGFQGQIWFSIDAPYSGRWIIEISRTFSQYKNISNFLIDSTTDWTGESEWLTYIVRLASKESHDIWARNRPISFNKSFAYVVWPDGTTTNIPRNNKTYEWVDCKSTQEIHIPILED